MRTRGIENLLLRRVRRHRSMTALFRAPDMESGSPSQSKALPVIHQKEEQDSFPSTQSPEVSPSISSSIPSYSNAVARQVVAPSTPTPKPLAPPPSILPEPEPAKMPDPVWKRLQTIFRKHQEEGNPPTAETTDREVSPAPSLRSQTVYEAKADATQAVSAEKPSSPIQKPATVIPSTAAVQRFSENVETQSPNILHKAQPLPSTPPETMEPVPARNTEFKPVSPDKITEVHDETPAGSEPEKPSLPLESAWNVQRVDASHPLFQENIPALPFDSRAADKNETSTETAPVSEQKPIYGPIQLQQEDDLTSETPISDSPQAGSPEPVEILSPSRPRPPQVDIPSKSVRIQRQSEDSHAFKDSNEATPVNTAIGPLPADLWWLLGQKAPSGTPLSQPDIQRTIHSDQKQVPSDQSKIANPLPTPAEPLSEPTPGPGTIQRQAISPESLPSSRQEPASSPRTKESKPTETPDLDDLARRVYAEVRRRLAAEWERRR